MSDEVCLQNRVCVMQNDFISLYLNMLSVIQKTGDSYPLGLSDYAFVIILPVIIYLGMKFFL